MAVHINRRRERRPWACPPRVTPKGPQSNTRLAQANSPENYRTRIFQLLFRETSRKERDCLYAAFLGGQHVIRRITNGHCRVHCQAGGGGDVVVSRAVTYLGECARRYTLLAWPQMLNPTWQIDPVREHGSKLHSDGRATFCLWAPAHPQIQLRLEGSPHRLLMKPIGEGWHQVSVPRLSAGTRYAFVLPDGMTVPDPASHYQPDGVDGISELIDPRAYRWRDHDWRGKPWQTAVVYELHVGTFTPQGTFLGVMERLDHLVALGITAIELMPVGAFPGRRNWGYDVAFPYACHATYGHPDDLKRLVDEAHARGLMVLLDVVYNHFGPKGNYLPLYAPQFFTERHHTPWGAGINFDGPDSGPVREFVVGNAVRWVEEFHFDGLRLDAVHAILDDSDRHVIEELAARVRAAVPQRIVHLVLENEDNQASLLTRVTGRPTSFTAQWNDDVHHVLHAAATQEGCGYYADYLGDTEKLGRALAEGFAFQGEIMNFRGSERGEASWFLPPDAFVAFIQNHDQIGNRAHGERWGQLASKAARRAVAAVYLLLPEIPMLFMGEEWDAPQPFPFFCDFEGELGQAVREGRRAEFAHLPEFAGPESRHLIPDPLSSNTFDSAILRWDDCEQAQHKEWHRWYRHVLAVRRAEILPCLMRLTGGEASYFVRGPQGVTVQWLCGGGTLLRLNANLSDSSCSGFPAATGRTIWQEGVPSDSGLFQPWSIQWEVICD
jgi:malto-oligosyltrehalose trehalohydrolase